MAFSELIKNFSKIREYMSQFYIYGFKSRNEYTSKSARSYDNERRRIESWLGDYMSFRQNANGKNIFIAVDSRNISHNPLYNAFKAKSFTDNDIMLHFYLLDILSDSTFKSIREIADIISLDYLSLFDDYQIDESTIRKKLKEYEKLGIIKSEKNGKELIFSKNEDEVDLASWKDAVAFFSEENPIGVVGSYVLDKYESIPDYFSFKHHYILYALESEILFILFEAIREHRAIEIEVNSPKRDNIGKYKVFPIKIYVSTQGGRQYLMAYHYRLKRAIFYRLDSINKISIKQTEEEYGKYCDLAEKFKKNLWGVSIGRDYNLDHIEMTLLVGDDERYILNRQTIANLILTNYFGKGIELFDSFETVHNYIDLKNNVVRKGAVSAQRGEMLLIPINMRDGSLICVGKGNADWNCSAPHGAGRLMSRGTARDLLSIDEYQKEMAGVFSTCVKESTIDESPMAYKNKDEIVTQITPTADVLLQIKPIYNFKAD